MGVLSGDDLKTLGAVIALSVLAMWAVRALVRYVNRPLPYERDPEGFDPEEIPALPWRVRPPEWVCPECGECLVGNQEDEGLSIAPPSAGADRDEGPTGPVGVGP